MKNKTIFCLLFLLLFSASISAYNYPRVGIASYYTKKSCIREGTSGIWTASGERFNERALTCAVREKALFKKYLKVTNLINGKSVIVRVNDFGPNKRLFKKGRIIDLSKKAFRKIADLKTGLVRVKIEIQS